MSLYYLLKKSSAVNPLPPSPIIRPIPSWQQNSMAVMGGNVLDPNLSVGSIPNQAFQVTATGTGAITAAVQIYGSNDAVNWSKIGSPVNVSGTGSANNGANGSIGYSFFGALITSITGTNCSVTCTMNA